MNTFDLADDELLLRIKQNDSQSFKVIFNRYWKRLYFYAYKIYQDSDLCDDCVQDLFVSLWENREHVVILNLEAYLFKAIKYQVSKHVNRLNFQSISPETLSSLSEGSTIENTLEYQEFEEEINTKITALPIRCREVFVLSRFQHKTNAEIATQLKISIRTVETHISHALKQLRSQMDESLYLIIIVISIFL
ncbi:ECF subfamily RNA polymerase sigma-24 subunit [Galbibacter marinus]|uniref:ECF subfamily RNA polymerase sigma-24 subunit n=1 Tax=Galbibacter marinus TaxID=555500 RepID=K2Q0K6_9FLAO|nr:RNA polymerase sigma-70 factor [Galbibacter marinus]EKF54406.1 ECF subfamily RNA polymerase sigma-24 subunit [Galbibacter marinus]